MDLNTLCDNFENLQGFGDQNCNFDLNYSKELGLKRLKKDTDWLKKSFFRYFTYLKYLEPLESQNERIVYFLLKDYVNHPRDDGYILENAEILASKILTIDRMVENVLDRLTHDCDSEEDYQYDSY